jgi:hypothetical protein
MVSNVAAITAAQKFAQVLKVRAGPRCCRPLLPAAAACSVARRARGCWQLVVQCKAPISPDFARQPTRGID